MDDQKTLEVPMYRGQTEEGYYNSYKRQSIEKRNKPFTLSFTQFWNLKKQPCFYCGALPESGIIGIDRIRSNDGYTPTNSVPCCFECNSLKNDKTMESYIDRCIRVAEIHQYRTHC
jgi:hypothetical protein